MTNKHISQNVPIPLKKRTLYLPKHQTISKKGVMVLFYIHNYGSAEIRWVKIPIWGTCWEGKQKHPSMWETTEWIHHLQQKKYDHTSWKHGAVENNSPQHCWPAQAKAKLIKQEHAKCLSPHLQLLLQLCHSPLQHPPVLTPGRRDGGGQRGSDVEKRKGHKRWVKTGEKVVQVGRREERASTDSRGGSSEAVEATTATTTTTTTTKNNRYQRQQGCITFLSSSSKAEQSVKRSCLCWIRQVNNIKAKNTLWISKLQPVTPWYSLKQTQLKQDCNCWTTTTVSTNDVKG